MDKDCLHLIHIKALGFLVTVTRGGKSTAFVMAAFNSLLASAWNRIQKPSRVASHFAGAGQSRNAL